MYVLFSGIGTYSPPNKHGHGILFFQMFFLLLFLCIPKNELLKLSI